MEVAGATDVGVGYRRPVRGCFGPPAIEVVLQDGVDRGVGARADVQCPFAGGFEPLVAMALGQPQNADASAEPLLGMRLLTQDDLDKCRRVASDLASSPLEALWRQIGEATVARLPRDNQGENRATIRMRKAPGMG